MPNIFKEVGTLGLNTAMGFVEQAYLAELRWPAVQPLYSRLRRSDPEITIIRQIYAALARGITLRWELPDDASDGDKKAQEFGEQVLDDIDGGVSELLETMVSNVPFFGWGWWEHLWCIRRPDWRPPGHDDWRSSYNDGLIGLRRLAWRDTSSFERWDMDDATGQVFGMVQSDYPNPLSVTIPLERSLHLTFGDPHNPEGLSPLEAIYRLERIKHGLEVIQGIGFEHSAGHLSVTTEGMSISDEDKARVREAARAIMMAQEGNYAFWPRGFTGELVDSDFSAAGSILEAIRYYGILKLLVYNMQWVAISSVSGKGSYSAMDDSSTMYLVTYNAMIDGFVQQMDKQIGRRLFELNAGAFPGMTRRPRLVAEAVQKTISLSELAAILGPIKNVMPLGEDDFKAIRARTGFLPETLPETTEGQPEPNQSEPENVQENNPVDEDGNEEDTSVSTETSNKMTLYQAQQVKNSLERWKAWARENDQDTFKLLNEELQ